MALPSASRGSGIRSFFSGSGGTANTGGGSPAPTAPATAVAQADADVPMDDGADDSSDGGLSLEDDSGVGSPVGAEDGSDDTPADAVVVPDPIVEQDGTRATADEGEETGVNHGVGATEEGRGTADEARADPGDGVDEEGVVGAADEAATAARGTDGGIAATIDPGDETRDDGVGDAEDVAVGRVENRWTPDEGADLPGYVLSPADRLLDTLYGDHVHPNDGCHLAGGVDDDHHWRSRWKRLVQHSPTRYSVPKGRVGRRFLSILTREFQSVRERHWNSERPMVFIAAVLQRGDGVSRARDIRDRLMQRMDLWEEGHHAALVDDTEALLLSRAGPCRRTPDPESEARAFNSKVLSGRLRPAVRRLTSRDGGGVFQPDDADSKTGRPVVDVLREKHPDLREPLLIGQPHGSFEPVAAAEWKKPIPVNITAEVMERVATRLSGAAGPDGVDSVDLRNWLLRFGHESDLLRTEMAKWCEWLANSHPPWAAYRGLMAGRLVALDKLPGVRPLGIGSIFRRLLAKGLIAVIGQQATSACSNLNLCAGLPAGIEGAVHAVRQVTTPVRSAGEVPLPPAPPAEEAPVPQTGESVESVIPTGTLLVDARNGFNELNRKAMLWTVRSKWPNGALFAFNCYRHSGQLILRRQGRACETLLSKEGVTQGDPLSMILYGVALLPLTESLRAEEPTVLQPWYADDAAMVGPVDAIARAMRLLEARGPARGYYPEPAKSIFVPDKAEQADDCRTRLQELQFQHKAGARYVGGFVGTEEARQEWLLPQIQNWIYGVEKLASVAKRYPQTAYAGLVKSLQTEWTYLQRVVPDLGPQMVPLEAAISDTFLPALFAEDGQAITGLRAQLSLSVKKAGLGVPNPITTAQANLEASVRVTAELTASLVERKDLNVVEYASEAGQLRRKGRKERILVDQCQLDSLKMAASSQLGKRRLDRATKTGAWLTATPDRLNGTDLSSAEFRDSLRLRFGLTPNSLPHRCDGCQQRFTVGHAMSCKKGGLVLLRHNDVANEWHELCAQALTPSAVTDEPLINTGQCRRGSDRAYTEPVAELRGDVAAHGFWTRGSTAVFDIRVTDLENQSQQGANPDKVLARHEKEKKLKYSAHCERQRKHFTPLVFSVDGLTGIECDAASKRLASALASKWKRSYGEVCSFVRTRLSIALVRSASRCLRWDRNPTTRPSAVPWATGTGLSLFR